MQTKNNHENEKEKSLRKKPILKQIQKQDVCILQLFFFFLLSCYFSFLSWLELYIFLALVPFPYFNEIFSFLRRKENKDFC